MIAVEIDQRSLMFYRRAITRGRPREGLGVSWGLGPVGSQYPFVRKQIARPSRDTSVEAGEGGIVDQLPGCTRLRPTVLFK